MSNWRVVKAVSAALVPVVVVFGVTVLAFVAGTAQGQTGVPYTALRDGTATPAQRAMWDDILKGAYRGQTADQIIRSVPSADRQGILSRLYRARVGSRLLPLAARTTLLGTGAYIAWTVYQKWFDGSSVVFDMWLDSRALGKDALFNVAQGLSDEAYNDNYGRAIWKWNEVEWQYRSGTSPNAHSTCPVTFGANPCARLRLRVQVIPAVSSWADEVPYERDDVVDGSGSHSFTDWLPWQGPDIDECIALYGNLCYGSGRGLRPANYKRHAAEAITRTLERVTDGRELGGGVVTRVQTYPTSNPAAGPLYGAYITGAQYMNLVRPESEVVTRGSVSTTSPNMTTIYNVPADQGTAADEDAALDAFDDECGRMFVNAALAPTEYQYEPGCITPESAPSDIDTMTLLRPAIGETYDDYITRLQAQGYVGVATRTDLTEINGDPRMGPEAVARLRVQTTTGTRVTYRSLAWPATSPQIRVDSEIEAFVNPDTYAPVDTGGLPPGTYPGGGDCDGWITAQVDFGPLLGIRCGDVFPFGVFVWLSDVWSDMVNQPPRCIEFALPYGDGSGELDVSLCSDLWENTYRDPLFLALQFCMTLLMLWWFAFRLIGLGDTRE